MLVDPPLRYHLPQVGWVRFDRAIDEIPEVRQEFVDWLEYGIKLVDSRYSVLDIDVIGVDAGPLSLIVDGAGMQSPPPPPDHADLPVYRAIERCATKARTIALEFLYCELIFDGRFRVYARKHEPDADLQLMPGSVWEATRGGREPRVSTAQLKTGKAYYDVHFERVAASGSSAGTPSSMAASEMTLTEALSDRLARETARMKRHIEQALPARLTQEMLRKQLGYSPRSEKFTAHYKVAKDQLQKENPVFAEVYKLGRPPKAKTARA